MTTAKVEKKKAGKQLKVTLVKSLAGRDFRVKRAAEALGFKRVNHTRTYTSSPALVGCLSKYGYLFKVESV